MGLHNNRYFLLSGLIAFAFFFLLLLLVGYTLLKTVRIEQFGMVQSEFVSISIVQSDTPATPETLSPKPQPVDEPVMEKPVEAKEEQQETVRNISDLFSQVKTQTLSEKKSDVPKPDEALSALEKEIMTPSEKQQLSEKVKKVEAAKPGTKTVLEGGSSGPVVNEYRAKIQGLIHSNFHPPSGSQGRVARVKIKISPEGKLLSYKVIAYADHTAFNHEVDWLKERLASIRFPSHPEGKTAVLECILTAKE